MGWVLGFDDCGAAGGVSGYEVGEAGEAVGELGFVAGAGVGHDLSCLLFCFSFFILLGKICCILHRELFFFLVWRWCVCELAEKSK